MSESQKENARSVSPHFNPYTMSKTLNETLREWVEGNYFLDNVENGMREKWEPFENWSDEQLEEQVELDIQTLSKFLIENKKEIIKNLIKPPYNV